MSGNTRLALSSKISNFSKRLALSAILLLVGTLAYHGKQGVALRVSTKRRWARLIDGTDEYILINPARAASLSMKTKTLRCSNLAFHCTIAAATGRASSADMILSESICERLQLFRL